MAMKRARVLVFFLVVFLLTVGLTSAQPRNFVAHLKGTNEVPPVSSRAQGQAIFHLSSDGSQLKFMLIVANIENVFAAHIHRAPAGVNGPIVAFLFSGSPSGRISGVLAEGTITAANLIGPLAGHPLSDLIVAINAGNAYSNVHTTAHPGGEIRGQIR